MAFDIDLRDLRYFETLARLEHVGKAAQQLHRTQPALTSAVRRLEAVCGAPLFERSGRGIRLAPAGEVLLKWAQRMRFDVEDAQREIAGLGKGLSGQIKIGIVPTAAQFLLPAAASELLAEAPDVTLKTVVGLVDTMKESLRTGELEVMVGTEVAADPAFVSRPLTEDQIVVAANANHALFRTTPRLADLTKYRWALQPEGAPTRDWLDQTFERKRLPRPVVQVEASMLMTLPALIAKTDLLSFIPRHYLSPGIGGSLREIALKETTMRRRLVVTYQKDRYLSPAVRRLIQLFEKSAQERDVLDFAQGR
jgi:DNA-binding transcriptional LysR family regulator